MLTNRRKVSQEFKNSAHYKRLGEVIDESKFDYADRLPENFNWDWKKIIDTAQNGKIGQGSPSGEQQARLRSGDPIQIAIIGAGAAGLTAGYELLKLGYQPVFYEMQIDPDNSNLARPLGRGYSWDFTCNNQGDSSGSFTHWFPSSVGGPVPTTANVSQWGRQIAELGSMRFPQSHVALRHYVDTVFSGDYYYDLFADVSKQWLEFRDPGLFTPVSPSDDPWASPQDSDLLKYASVIFSNGITNSSEPKNSRGFYKALAGTEFGAMNPAIKNLTYSNWNALFSANKGPSGGPGYLYNTINLYKQYTVEAIKPEPDEKLLEALIKKIKGEWYNLVNKYQGQTLFQALVDVWGTTPAYPKDHTPAFPNPPTLIELFGEIGIGSGGFDVFFWTTLMETLRIRLHLDETSQEVFVGGSSYMLSPFLTKNITPFGSSNTTNMWTATKGKVVTDPVVAIQPRTNDSHGVKIVTRSEDGIINSHEYIACIMTVAPSAFRSRINIASSKISPVARKGLQRLRLTNSGKIAINFPDIANQSQSQAFWKKRTESDPFNVDNDLIVTTITDENISSIYTFDDYHWGTRMSDRPNKGLKTGSLMLSYNWDFKSDAMAPLSNNELVRTAWDQVKSIYNSDPNKTVNFDTFDEYIQWALDHGQAQSIVWTNVDGFGGGYRMADTNRDFISDPTSIPAYSSEQEALWLACQTGEISDGVSPVIDTGLFIAGEAVAWLGLSGWIEGAIHTGLASTIGVVRHANKYFNEIPRSATVPGTKKSFSLPMLPGDKLFIK